MLRKKQAFTLMEIMAVVIIVGILSVLAIPKYQNAIEKTHSGEAVHILGSVLDAAKSYKFERGSYPTSMDELDITIDDSEFYESPVLVGTDDSVATIARDGGSVDYTLGINVNGVIDCQSSNSAYCGKLGY